MDKKTFLKKAREKLDCVATNTFTPSTELFYLSQIEKFLERENTGLSFEDGLHAIEYTFDQFNILKAQVYARLAGDLMNDVRNGAQADFSTRYHAILQHIDAYMMLAHASLDEAMHASKIGYDEMARLKNLAQEEKAKNEPLEIDFCSFTEASR